MDEKVMNVKRKEVRRKRGETILG
jgi:hypothetical protein